MDYAPLLTALHQLWWIITILIGLTILRSPWFKGLFGESLVRLSAKVRLSPDAYHSLHNVTLHTLDGTTQVDHIILSRYGVFVIETKHMKGWIFGSEQDEQWTQSIFGKSYKFQNPLRQNYKHVKAVESALNIPVDLIHSIVVFTGDGTFKSMMPDNVVHGGAYISYIKSFQQPVFSDKEVGEMLHRIQNGRLPKSFTTHQQHVSSLRTRTDPSAERRCPKCGGRMIIRTAKTGRNAGGQFWGCSSFPRCRTVQSVG